MIRLLYNLLFPVGLLLFLPAYVLKMRRRGNYRRNFGQRFGIYSHAARARRPLHSATWIHAVSVGEVAIALKLAARLHQLDPAFRCVLTTTTSTGFAFAETEASEWMQVMYNPLDFWPVVQRAFAMIRPARIILVEAEIWPNLAAGARAPGSARARERTFIRALGAAFPAVPSHCCAYVSLSRSRLRAGTPRRREVGSAGRSSRPHQRSRQHQV